MSQNRVIQAERRKAEALAAVGHQHAKLMTEQDAASTHANTANGVTSSQAAPGVHVMTHGHSHVSTSAAVPSHKTHFHAAGAKPSVKVKNTNSGE